jgi:hypothetical protein
VQHDLLRRRRAQSTEHLRAFADERLDQALRFLGVGRLGDRTGQKDQPVHRRCVDVGLGHGQLQHLIHRSEILPDADVG